MKAVKLSHSIFVLFLAVLPLWFSCGDKAEKGASQNETSESSKDGGQSKVQDGVSKPTILQVAMGSKDHTTLVAAVKAADLEDDLSNVGPFTVFAPTNEAFNKLPAGTVEGLLKPEKKNDLVNILGYHTFVGGLKLDYMNDGQAFDMVFGGKVTITKKEGKTFVNGSPILGTVEASNGVVYVIGDVLLPPAPSK